MGVHRSVCVCILRAPNCHYTITAYAHFQHGLCKIRNILRLHTCFCTDGDSVGTDRQLFGLWCGLFISCSISCACLHSSWSCDIIISVRLCEWSNGCCQGMPEVYQESGMLCNRQL